METTSLTEQATSNVVRLYKGEETKIVHESFSVKNASLFASQYYKALNVMGEFLTDNSSDNNNIIAFIGDRGTGKTSCMESFADIACEIKNNKDVFEKDENVKQDVKKTLSKTSFHKLPTIDPTTFNDDTNLMQVVIGVMFEKFKEYVTNADYLPCHADKRDEYENKKQKLLKAFQDVKECLKFINNPKLLKCEDDDISQMAGMAAVSNLNEKIENLADAYLKFFDRQTLILPIDDIDLQTTYAYQMIEEIRKYFIHKNIIVLMAIRMEQLVKVLENNSAKTYKPLREFDASAITLSEIYDMAVRYLLKLIPIAHRIYMPAFEVYANGELEYYKDREDQQPQRWTSVKYAITSLIYQKCRFLFYHTKGVVSPIVPRNLRELRHLFAMLEEMKDYNKKKPDFGNKARFLDYFYNTWVQNNIDPEDLHIVNVMLHDSEVSTINKLVIMLLKEKYYEMIASQEQFSEITSEKNVSYNVSIADAYSIIDYIKQRVEALEDRNLIFFIESYYSILLYQYYDQITEEYQPYYNSQGVNKTFKKMVDISIRRRTMIDAYSNYEVLVGGRFINTEVYHLMQTEQETNLSRDNRPVSLSKLSDLAVGLVTMFSDVRNLNSKIFLLRMWIVEFFALCTSRVLDYRPNVNKKYREYSDVCYTYEYNNKNDSLQFDLGTFFFNITNIERAYNRINPQFFNIAKKTKNSLYNKLLDRCLDIRGWENKPPYYALLSCACIRNFDVLSELINEIQYGWQGRSVSKENIENLIKFFNGVKDFFIRTYDKDDVKFDEQSYVEKLKHRGPDATDDVSTVAEDELNKQVDVVAYKITFEYVDSVTEVLREINNLDSELFNQIFSPSKEKNEVRPTKKAITLNKFDVDAIMAVLPNQDEFSLNVFLRRVRECCRPIFKGNKQLIHNWLHLEIFEVQRSYKKVRRDVARQILVQFKKDNNLQ